jgi:type II secretory pathway pseudopilin PulG
VAVIGIGGVAVLAALALWAWPGPDASLDGAEQASVGAANQRSAAQEAHDASPTSPAAPERSEGRTDGPEAMRSEAPSVPDEPAVDPEPSGELPPPVTPRTTGSTYDTPKPDEAQLPQPPRRRDPPRGTKPRRAPPPDDVVGARLAKKARARCAIEGETLHVTSALGGDGRVLSVSINGGSGEQRTCVRNVAKRAKYAPGRARIVEIDVSR